jgi:hypothetical protein
MGFTTDPIMLLQAICGPKEAAAQTTTAIAIRSVSQKTAKPFQLIAITGSGLDPNQTVSVVFAQGRKSVSVLAPSVTTSVVEVGVPFNITGNVTVQVVQTGFTNVATKSNQLKGLRIAALPTLKTPLGSVTLSFLQGQVAQIQQAQTALQGTLFDTQSAESDLSNSMAAMNTLMLNVEGIMEKPSKNFSVAETEKGKSINVKLLQVKY